MTVIAPAPTARKAKDLAFRLSLLACLGLSIGLLGLLLYDVIADGAGRLSFGLLDRFPSFDPERAGLESALWGTIWLMGVCALFIVPVGVATAVYLEEYADRERWWNRLIEVNIQNLAAVPSIVYGILGLAFLVRGPLSLGRVVLAGALTLGLLVLPVVIIAAREAIRAVPPSIREGSLALGATQWQTIWKQVLPSAIPGVATGVILALSRAIGETAPLILVGAATFVAFNPSGLDSSFTALPLQIFNWISQPQPEFKALAAAGILVLLTLLLAMNAVAIWLRNRYERKW
ncbi:MAG TPA: phosphate ABC transporter permease PstA [Solirubrobacteraceae bacterium]|nr:phosphate ABC transporter permease PstA [Solirubrobacteraceae bacterium]